MNKGRHIWLLILLCPRGARMIPKAESTSEYHVVSHSPLPHPESERRSVVSNSLQPHGLYSPWNSPGQNTGVGSLSLLHGIFPAQGSNPGLPHCGQILYQPSHQESPRMLEWVVNPFSCRSSWPRRILYQLSYQRRPLQHPTRSNSRSRVNFKMEWQHIENGIKIQQGDFCPLLK